MNLQATLLALLAPELSRSEKTRTLAVSNAQATRSLGEYVGQILLLQSDVTVAIALSGLGEAFHTASLTADHGGVRVPSGLLVLHTVRSYNAHMAVVGSATGTLWYAPVSALLPR